MRRARAYRERAFGEPIVRVAAYRGDGTPLRLLVLLAANGGNIVTTLLLDDRQIEEISFVAGQLSRRRRVAAARPDLQRDRRRRPFGRRAGRGGTHRRGLGRTGASTTPRAVRRTAARAIARFAGLPGVTAPLTVLLPRERIDAANACGARLHVSAAVAFARLSHGRALPLRRGARRPGERRRGAARRPELLAIAYLDARGADGNARKYRALIVDGALYPVHLAIARQLEDPLLLRRHAPQRRQPCRRSRLPRRHGRASRTARRRGRWNTSRRRSGSTTRGSTSGSAATATCWCSKRTRRWRSTIPTATNASRTAAPRSSASSRPCGEMFSARARCAITRSTNVARAFEHAVALDQQVAADQQHRVGPVEVEQFLDALQAHPAGRHRQRRAHVAPRRARAGGQRRARLARVAETAADVHEDHRIAAEQPQQPAEQQLRRDRARAAERRVREVDEVGELLDQFVVRRQADEHRRDQHRAHALLARDPRAFAQHARRADEVRRVERRLAGRAHRFGDRGLARAHALDERRVGLIVDAVIVLDRCRRRRARTCGTARRVRRRAGPAVSSRRWSAGAPARPAARGCRRCRGAVRGRARARSSGHLEPGERDVVPERGVAEHHVHELRGVRADRLRGDRDVDAEAARARRVRSR